MNKEIDSKITEGSLEQSLRDKGAIKDGRILSHEEVLNNKEYRTLDGQERLSGVLFDRLTNLEHEYLRFLRTKQEITKLYQGSKNWEDIVTSEYFNTDATEDTEAFIVCIEEVYQTRIKDAKHLEKLTGLTNEMLKKERNIEPGAEATLDIVLQLANMSRYNRALSIGLLNGAKYKDLLQVKPKEYGLPETWEEFAGRTGNQYNSILWAIHSQYLLGDRAGVRADLSTIAEALESPLSVIVEALKTWD